MKYLSLFAGIGGFDLGMDQAGMTCLGQVEIDPAASSVLAARWPDVPRWTDVRDFHGQPQLVDLVCGGFPCQDVSIGGKRAGLGGERSGLWFEYRRVLEEIRPDWAIIENVPGLLSSNGGRDMGTVLRGLGDLGYGFAYRVLDARFIGVPQRRRRLFIVGCRRDWAAPAEVLLEPENRYGDDRSRYETWKDPAWPVAQGADVGFVPFVKIVRSGARDANGDLPAEVWAEQWVAPTLNTFDTGETRTNTLIVEVVNSGDGAITGPSYRVRRLTPTECERLQGFPDGWTAPQADSPRYHQLGNAVAVPCSKWIAERIMKFS